MDKKFILDQKLAIDTIYIKDLKLSQLLLMNNSNYPWFILVPKKNYISELFELSTAEQTTLIEEISWVSKIIKSHFHADKINIANLGNVVQQLHVHIIARFKTDLAWPDPIWGKVANIAYKDSNLINKYKNIFD